MVYDFFLKLYHFSIIININFEKDTDSKVYFTFYLHGAILQFKKYVSMTLLEKVIFSTAIKIDL